MNSILSIVIWIALGMGLGVLCKNSPRLLRMADRIALFAVYGLLFLLGAGLGADKALFAELPRLGGTALCIALCCVAGSVLCLGLARKFLLFPAALGGGSTADRAKAPTGPEKRASSARRPENKAAAAQGKKAGTAELAHKSAEQQKTAGGPAVAPSLPLWGTVRILVFFTLGIACSRAELTPARVLDSSLTTYALYLLVLAVGVGLGADLKAFGVVRVMRLRILAVPPLIVAGTFAGAAAASAVLPGLGLRDSFVVGAGFGYYSLSSLLIEDSGNAALASVALLSNIFREMAGLLGAPLLARLCGPLAPVAAAGATAMDTCLPVIARFSGERYAVVAVFSGMVLTLAVPFLVSAILRW